MTTPTSGPQGVVMIGPVEAGEHSYISEYSHVSQGTKIGKFCSIGNLCTLGAQQHRMTGLSNFPFQHVFEEARLDPQNGYRETHIGHDVWIGSNAVVMAGLTIGTGAVIGAGAVVTKSIPPYAIAVGNPARVLRYRFAPDVIGRLLASEWWNLPLETLRVLPMDDIEQALDMLRVIQRKEAA